MKHFDANTNIRFILIFLISRHSKVSSHPFNETNMNIMNFNKGKKLIIIERKFIYLNPIILLKTLFIIFQISR